MPALLHFRGGRLEREGQLAEWPELAVVGAPVAHSQSPTLHEAALAAAGLSLRYDRIHVEAGQLPDFLSAALQARMRGLSLTLPHKETVLEAGVRRAEEVARVGAANTLVRRGEVWVAHNTDLRGFALALQRWRGGKLGLALREVLIVGAGGAARAVLAALEDLGAGSIRVAARHSAGAHWAALRGASVEPLETLQLGSASLVVQCTSLGWRQDDPSPLTLSSWSSRSAAYDLCYAPHGTAFLRQAKAAGAPCEDGRSMLIAQAALAFTMWFGGESPLRTMARSMDLDWDRASGTESDGET